MGLGIGFGTDWGSIKLGPESGGGVNPDACIIQVQTDNTGTSADNQFTLPWIGTYDVDWGDGNVDTSVSGTQTHTYASAGTYDISVTATSGQIRFNNGGDKSKLLEVKQWGTCAWTSMASTFRGCSNLTVTAIDAPNLTLSIDISKMFDDCTLVNFDASNWDTSNVINMHGMFLNAGNFNGDVTTWNTSNVTDMSSMFSQWKLTGTRAFNQNLNNWDVSNVTNMAGMLAYLPNFNSPLDNWDVSNVTSMRTMFVESDSFNQDIGGWNVSNVIDMFGMFRYINSFDQDISSWGINQVSNFTVFMQGVTLSTANYDALLIAWDAQGAMSFSGTVNFGSSQYTLGGAAETARTSLISKWGGIIDGGGV